MLKELPFSTLWFVLSFQFATQCFCSFLFHAFFFFCVVQCQDMFSMLDDMIGDYVMDYTVEEICINNRLFRQIEPKATS